MRVSNGFDNDLVSFEKDTPSTLTNIDYELIMRPDQYKQSASVKWKKKHGINPPKSEKRAIPSQPQYMEQTDSDETQDLMQLMHVDTATTVQSDTTLDLSYLAVQLRSLQPCMLLGIPAEHYTTTNTTTLNTLIPDTTVDTTIKNDLSHLLKPLQDITTQITHSTTTKSTAIKPNTPKIKDSADINDWIDDLLS
jgi:hypothetical protein